MPEKKSKPKQFAELLDSKFTIPNTNIRFGIDPLLGLIPGAGDWVGGAISLYFLFYAALLKAKGTVLARMAINILLDVLIGSIPLLGDLFDVYWKANKRNVAILEELEQNPAKTTAESRFWVWSIFVQIVVLIVAILLFIGWLIAWLLDFV